MSSANPASRPSGSAGPIKTLKRTFSSAGSTTTAGLGAATTTTTMKKKLPASAYDFDLDDDDVDDWGDMDMDLGVGTSTSVNKTSTSTLVNLTSATASVSSKSATNIISTAKTSLSAANLPQSPPRAPRAAIQMQSASMMLASQPVNLPSLPRVPSVVVSKKNDENSSKIKDESNDKAAALSPNVVKSKTRVPPAGWTEPVKPMSSRTMQAPFTKAGKAAKGQTSLSGFVVKSDEESSSGSRKRQLEMPWETSNLKPVKAAKTNSAESSSSSSKGKGTGIGSVNVKQQIVLSQEQQKVLKMVVEERKNVFFTGSAGTGKSILLKEIIASLRRKYAGKGADRVAITASTGMAAANIGGTTIHSFAGVGLGQGTGEQLIDYVKKNKKAAGRWLRTEVLFIDEVSMVDGDLFDKLAHIACRFRRKDNKPFGGIQLIMTGDFFQLPPVTKSGPTKFAFEAKAWKECIDATVNLKKVFRQKDTEFVDMLNEMRFGQLTPATITKFHKLKRQPKYDDGIEPTELFPLREQVDSSNRSRLAALPGETFTYTAIDEGEEPFDKMQKTLDNVMAPRSLVLKLDAQVMLLKNMDVGLVNGSVGRVIGFKAADELDEEDDPDFYSKEMEEFQAKIAQMKSKDSRQGSREPSAAPSDGGGAKDGKAGGPVKKAKNAAMAEKCPIVAWKLPDGGTIKMRMQREEFKVEDNGDKVKARRKQFPMICAWAMSIHKSQGQTLERVKCDLGKIFEKGQAYVALSRATSLDGLQVLNFNPTKVLAHPKVVAWTKTLTELE